VVKGDSSTLLFLAITCCGASRFSFFIRRPGMLFLWLNIQRMISVPLVLSLTATIYLVLTFNTH